MTKKETRNTDIPDSTILEAIRLIRDGVSITKTALRVGLPYSTLATRLGTDRWREEYKIARTIGLEMQADGLIDYIKEYKPVDKIDGMKLRLLVDTKKWILSKQLPKSYGDKIDLNHGGQGDNPIITKIEHVIVDRLKSANKPIDVIDVPETDKPVSFI